MEAKRRQQQLCVQALHHQPVNNHCTHGAPLSYLPSPWVMWDAGRLAEANRRRKQKKRLCTACLLAGVAVAVLAVAGVAGLAVYLGGSPPTDGSTKWESFRRAGEARPGEEMTTHRIHNRHGILFRADSTERTTPPARSPWAIRREEGVRWEGRGGGTSASPGETPREDHVDFAYEESEGVPEIEVVLEGREGEEPLSDRSADGDAQEDETESHSARSPFARASEGRRPPVAPSAHLPETSGSPLSPPAEDRESFVEGSDKEWATTPTVRESSVKDVHPKKVEEGEKSEGVRRRNHWHWDSAGDEDGGIYGTSSEEAEESGEVGEREEEEEGLEGDGGEGEEEEMSEEEREGGEERRQQQASNKVATEGIPVFNMLTKILKRLNSSSIPKEAEIPNLNNGTIECSPGQFRCATANEGIMCLPASSRCDGVRDCTLSGEDETGCNCADTLRSRFLHRKLCDGVPDCWDYSDEDQCAWCTPGHLVCGGGARICVEPERICDGVKDCPGGDDESRCIALSSGEEERETKMLGPEARRVYQRDRNWSSSARSSDHVTASMVTNEVLPYRSSGYLLVRKKGVWGKLCLDESESKEIVPNKVSWNAAEIGYKVCKAMTHRDFEAVEEVTDDEKFKGINSTKSYPPYYQLQQISSNTDILESMQSLHTTECSSKKVMRVKCKDLECGVRPKIRLNQWSRIVGGGNAAPGAWPWQAALYREGEFQCGATLISDHWLVSAGHCFFHARDDYWVARLGTLRRGTDLPSPHEQRRPVSSVILHPGYVDAGFLNDIALLRLSSPVEITDHVRPACLPPRAVHIQMPSIQMKDVYQTTTEEGTSFPYDENVTTFSPLLNTYESIATEMNTDVPNIGENLNDLKGNTPTKDISLWESTLEEGNDYTDIVTESNSTSTQHYVSYEENQTTNIMGEYLHKQPEEEYSIPTFTSTKNSEYNPTLQVVVHAAYASINNQDPNTETTTPAPHIYSEVNNKDEAVEYKNENGTFSLESSTSQTQDIGKTIHFNTESFSLVTESMTPQYMSTNPIPEEEYLKNLSILETSTYQSSSQRLTSTDAVTSSQNVIQAGESKEKHGKDYAHSDELVKVTLSDTDAIPNYQNHRVQVESVGSTIIYSPVNLDNYSNDTKDIITEEQPIDFSVSKTSDSYLLRGKTQVEHDIINKKVSESLDVTSPNTLKIEQVHKYVKHHKKSQDNSNILLSEEKFLETKNVNKTLPMVPDVHDEVKSQEKSASVDSFPLATEPITLHATMKETSAESIKQSVKVREARDADTDDGADDGIRNGRLCTVVGWGQLFEVGRIFPDTLQEVELPLISTKECRKRTLFLPLYHLTDAMFCAGYDRGGRDACLGDSGGPLMCQESDDHWSLYGVTSNGYGCARANRPGVYTKVSHYIPWMEEAMAREDEAQEEQQKEEERRGKEAVGEGEGWRQRWEWRRRGEEQGVGGGKHFCPHRCPLGECLQRARLCNGVVDCSDASDEQSCQGEINLGR